MNDTDNKQMLRLIELYFEGETTLEQERELRRMLATSPLRTPEVEEARAVLGVVAMMPRERVIRRPSRFIPVIQRVAAAAAILVAVIGISVYLTHVPEAPADNGDECFAYIGQEEVRDPKVVLDIMHEQLSYMAAVSDEVNQDIENNLNIIRQQ